MEVLNNRYKITKLIKSSRIYSIYHGIDLKNNVKVAITILDANTISQNFIKFCIESCSSLSILNQKGLIPIYEFGLLKYIDNKAALNKTYYYTNKIIDSDKHLCNIKFSNREEIIHVFIKLCNEIKYLNDKGFNYKYLNDDVVYYDVDKDEIILKDILSVELTKYEFSEEQENKELFKPYEGYNEENEKSKQIYALGVFLLILFLKYKEINVNSIILQSIIKNVNNGYNKWKLSEYIDNDLCEIVKKMINIDSRERYKNIDGVISDISKIYDVSDSELKIESVNVLNFDTKVVGRNEEVASILSVYESINKYEVIDKTIAIHGEFGIGKTTFLKYLEYVLNLNGVKIYSNLKDNFKEKNMFLNYILKDIIKDSSKIVIEKYKKTLVKFVPEMFDDIDDITYFNRKEGLKCISEISYFLDETFEEKPIVIILDNLDYADEYTLKLFLYNFKKYNKNSKVLVIFSYCDGQCLRNKKFMEFLNKVEENIRLNIRIRELNIDETREMIKNILSKGNLEKEFIDAMYSISKGNPLFIEELLKNPELNYSNGNSIDELILSKFSLPKKIYDEIEQQIWGFDDITYKILKTMAIFNKGVSMQLILKITNVDRDVLREKINELISSGVLCKKIEDSGFVYDFYNKFLKVFLYKNIKDDERINMHKLAYKTLKQSYLIENYDYIEEIIYHVEKANLKDEIKYFCKINAERMLKINNKRDTIKNYLKIIKRVTPEEYDVELVKLLIKAGQLYKDSREIEQSMECFKKASEIGEENGWIILTIDATLELMYLHFVKTHYEEVEKYQNKLEELFKKCNYEEGNISYVLIKAQIYFNKLDYINCYKMCNIGIRLCDEKNIEYKVKFYELMTRTLVILEKPEEALPILKEAIKICDSKNSIQKAKMYNSMGIIYSDFYEDIDNGLKCFKEVKRIGENNSFEYFELLGLINVGFIQYSLDQYDECYKTFKSAIKKARVEGNTTFELYSKLYISSLLFKLGKYSESYRYYIYSKDYVLSDDLDIRDKAQFYILEYKFNYISGKIDEAKKSLESAKLMYKSTGSVVKREVDTLYNLLCLEEDKELIVNGELKFLKDMLDDAPNKESIIGIIFLTITSLYSNGNLEEAKKLLEVINEYKDCIEFNGNIIKLEFFNHVLYEEISLNKLYDIFNKLQQNRDELILWIVLMCIGDYFLNKGQYDYASIYYFESCGSVIDITLQVPRYLRRGILQKNNMHIVFTKFKSLLEFYKRGKEVLDLQEYEIEFNDDDKTKEIFKDILNEEFMFSNIMCKKLKESNAIIKSLKITSTDDLLNKFAEDTLYNISLILNYISYLTISSKVMVVIENDKQYEVLQENNHIRELPKDICIINKVRDRRKPIIEYEQYSDYIDLEICKKSTIGAKSKMCIPVIMDNKLQVIAQNRKVNTRNSSEIKGYLYLESDKILNNINENTLNICLKLCKILGVLIDKHLVELNSSLDKLTGTITRKYLEKAIVNQIKCSSECNSSFSILMFDIDFFKNINDKFGHRRGDDVLRDICQEAMKNIRETDVCGRYGGEEFIVVLPDTNSEEALKIAERIRKGVKEKDILQGKIDVTISIGVANYPSHALNYDELVEKVDQALYAAKNSGRNKSLVWDETYKCKLNSLDKITGIISGNINRDIRTATTIMEVIEIVAENKVKENVLYICLGKIIETMECDTVSLFIIENEKIIEKYTRKAFDTEWSSIDYYDRNLIEDVIKNKKTINTIEWDNTGEIINNKDRNTSMLVECKSILMVPVISSDKVKAILCLSVHAKKKEFNMEDANIISMIGKIMIPRL